MKNIAIILSGGTGTRLGESMPKQYLEVGGKPIIRYCLESFAAIPSIHAFVIVVAPAWRNYVEEQLKMLNSTKEFYSVLPGETRQYSIFNALQTARQNFSEEDVVIIHDAARPLVSQSLIEHCLAGIAEGYDGVLPVLPVKDTIYQSNDREHISQLLPRATLFAGQAPEAFILGKYLNAHLKMSHAELLQINGSTELAYRQGLKIKLIPGEERNFKITTLGDLERFKLLIQQ